MKKIIREYVYYKEYYNIENDEDDVHVDASDSIINNTHELLSYSPLQYKMASLGFFTLKHFRDNENGCELK